MKLNLHGRDGADLSEVWRSRVESHMGLQIHGFPNMFLINNVLTANVRTKNPRNIDSCTNVIMEILAKMRSEGLSTIESTATADKT